MGLLRLYLAVVVVVGHNQFGSVHIGTGVIVAVKAFFIISGFYMALVLSERYDKTRLSVFWTNRLLRLLPMYYAVLAVTLVVLLLTPGGRLNVLLDLGSWKALLDAPGLVWLKCFLVMTNASCLAIETTIYATVDLSDMTIHRYGNGAPGTLLNNFVLVPQAWSISVELAFYAVAPFVVRTGGRTFLLLLAAAALLRVGIRVLGLDYNPINRSVAPLELIYFLLGVASYRLYARVRHWRVRGLASIVTVAVLAFTAGFIPLSREFGLSPLQEGWLWWVYFVSLTLGLPFVFHLTKTSRLDGVLGELSYPVYLSHILVLAMFDWYGGRQLFDAVGGQIGWQLLNIATVVVVAQALVMFVGNPVERYRRRRLAAALVGRDHAEPVPAPVARSAA